MEKTIEIPEGYEARIEGNKVILEPKESEDEKMRKGLLRHFKNKTKPYWNEIAVKDIIAYLERQKEQHPAEWSEEDEAAFGDLMWCIEQARKSAKDENDMGNIWFAENWVKNRLKSLRPQPHWKPSEDQMETLKHFIGPSPDGIILGELYSELEKLSL